MFTRGYFFYAQLPNITRILRVCECEFRALRCCCSCFTPWLLSPESARVLLFFFTLSSSDIKSCNCFQMVCWNRLFWSASAYLLGKLKTIIYSTTYWKLPGGTLSPLNGYDYTKILLILAWLKKNVKIWVDIDSDRKYLPNIFSSHLPCLCNLNFLIPRLQNNQLVKIFRFRFS